ncbi:hypothetical protein ZWY2020_047748 [Hordeum vulgare]|nr:hypothetical protein ZWY2020_047748 [Hordeum vulgare]
MEKVRHKRLVNLSGCCAEGDERLLVAEYMPNDTLSKHLFQCSLAPMETTLMSSIKFSASVFMIFYMAITAKANDSGSARANVTNLMLEACKNASGYTVVISTSVMSHRNFAYRPCSRTIGVLMLRTTLR